MQDNLTILDMIEKVSTWRKLFHGIVVQNKVTGETQIQ